ncbi:MAG: hypothetical protein QXD23_00625 [Candidatus Micrarchaeaceae archaeon]
MVQKQELNNTRLPYDNDTPSKNFDGQPTLIKKHILSVIFTFILFIFFIIFISYVLIISSSQSSKQLLNVSQSQDLLGSGTYSSFTSNVELFNVSQYSYIGLLLGNETAYVSEFEGSNSYYQELIVNRTNATKSFLEVYFDMSHQLNNQKVINGSISFFKFFYTNQQINTTSSVLTLVGKKNNTLSIISMLYQNVSINQTIKDIALDLNK